MNISTMKTVISMGMDFISLVMAEHMNRALSIVIPIGKIMRYYPLTIGKLLTNQEGQTTNLTHHIVILILNLFHILAAIIGSSAGEAVIMKELIHIMGTGRIIDLTIISGVTIITAQGSSSPIGYHRIQSMDLLPVILVETQRIVRLKVMGLVIYLILDSTLMFETHLRGITRYQVN